MFDNDSKKVAEELGTTKMQVDNVLNYDFEDVKLSKKLAKEINEYASQNVTLKDKLTKAYNRYYLEQKTTELFNQNKGFKFYYLDLNKFKPVNDDYGHEAGDEVLVLTTRRLENLISDEGFVSRLGGDEFVIVQLENLKKDLSGEIIKTIEEPLNISLTEDEINISTSIGICISEAFDDIDPMLKEADEKMFEYKKENGKGR